MNSDDIFSLFRNPAIVATWQVHVIVASLMALLGVWTGLSRRPWYVGMAFFLALLLLFIPIKAPEPALVLLVSVPLLTLGCRLLRPWLVPAESAIGAASPTPAGRWHFGLADLLWLMVVVGMLTLLLTRLSAMPRLIEWTDAAIGTGCFLAISLLTVVAHYQRRWVWKLATGILLLIVMAAAVVIQLAFVNDWWFIADFLRTLLTRLLGGYHWWRPEVALVYFVSFVEFSFLLLVGCWAVLPNSKPQSRAARIIRGMSGAGFAVSILLLGVVYSQMVYGPRTPAENWPERNEYPTLKETVRQCSMLNPQRFSLADLRKTAGPGTATELEQLYQTLDELLERDNVICFDTRSITGTVDLLNEATSLNEARSVVIAWEAESRSLVDMGDVNESIRYDLRIVRMGAAFRKRGALIHFLVGDAWEEVGISHLVEIRNQLTCNQIGVVASRLEKITATREPMELMLAREAFYDDCFQGWRGRLRRSLEEFQNSEKDYDPAVMAPRVANRHECRFALLHTELALLCFHQTHGRWPSSLDELLPDHLPSLPLDPFTRQPLIYRVEGDKYVLYSAGDDSVDDGGIFGSLPWYSGTSPGRDVDLDTWERDRYPHSSD